MLRPPARWRPPVPQEALEQVAWCGGDRFRALSLTFRVDWNWAPLGDQVLRVLGALAISADQARRNPPESEDARYGLVRLEQPDDVWFAVVEQDIPVFSNLSAGATLDWFFWRLNRDILRSSGDFFVIHAGAVLTPSGDGVVLPGKSGAGKSSLVAALVRDGFIYLSDEFAPIDPVAGGLYAFPKALTLKPGSFELFDGLAPPPRDDPSRGGHWHVPGDELGRRGRDGPHPIRWVIAPRYERSSPTRLEPMSRGFTAYTLGFHSPSLWAYGQRALPLLGAVARDASGFELVSGHLQGAVAAVRELTIGVAG